MKNPKSFVLRLAFALGIFDALQMALHHNITPANSDWQLWTTVYLMPFAFYWLIFYPVRKFVPEKHMLKVAWFLFSARFIKYLIVHLVWGYLEAASMRFAIGIVACLVVLLLPWPKFGDVLKKLMPVLAIPGFICMVIFLNTPETATFGAAPTTAARAGSPNIVLVSWDTLRADVLPMYGGTMLPMPRLQEFADTSIQFNDAVAHAPITGPSHASMLTGVVPPEHGVRSNVKEILPAAVPRLPQELLENGYRTGAFVAAYPLRSRFGFADGFEVYDDRMDESFTLRLKDLGYFDSMWIVPFAPVMGKSTRASTPGEVVQQRAFDWLDSLPENDPYFLFLHLYDAHGPWDPVGKYKEIADAGKGKAMPLAPMEQDVNSFARYRGDVAMMDDFLVEMLAELEKHDPGLENTVVLLTSDHGECFGEGGLHKTHTESLYEATQHVPMFLHLPGNQGAGLQVEETVTHSDIYPTLMAAAGLESDRVRNEDAYPLQQALLAGGMVDKARSVYMEAQHFNLEKSKLGDRRIQAWRTPEWKLIKGVADDDIQHLWKYRENEDDDYLVGQPDLAQALLVELVSYFDSLIKVEAGSVESSVADRFAASALGYGADVEEDQN
ncbi:MAG: sulfatase [Planctomycetota bacterium]